MRESSAKRYQAAEEPEKRRCRGCGQLRVTELFRVEFSFVDDSSRRFSSLLKVRFCAGKRGRHCRTLWTAKVEMLDYVAPDAPA